jgi:hypothetical protein
MPLLWKRADGEERNITPPHSFFSRKGAISALIYPTEKCILPYKRGKYAFFERITLKHTRVSVRFYSVAQLRIKYLMLAIMELANRCTLPSLDSKTSPSRDGLYLYGSEVNSKFIV